MTLPRPSGRITLKLFKTAFLRAPLKQPFSPWGGGLLDWPTPPLPHVPGTSHALRGSPRLPGASGLRQSREGCQAWLRVCRDLVGSDNGSRKPTSSWPALGVSNLQRPFFVDFWAPGGKKTSPRTSTTCQTEQRGLSGAAECMTSHMKESAPLPG